VLTRGMMERGAAWYWEWFEAVSLQKAEHPFQIGVISPPEAAERSDRGMSSARMARTVTSSHERLRG